MSSYIIHGETFLVNYKVNNLKHDLYNSINDEVKEIYLNSSNDIQEIVNACLSAPFLISSYFIIAEGLFGSYQNNKQSQKSTKKSKSNNYNDLLYSTILNKPANNHLILIDENILKSNTLFKKISPLCQIYEMQGPSEQDLPQWIVEHAKTKGITINNNASNVLAAAIGNDLWRIDRELEKLVLYNHGRTIDKETVEYFVDMSPEVNIFAAMDAIVAGDSSKSLALITKLIKDGRHPLSIISMINRQLRLIALAHDYKMHGQSVATWSKDLGFTSNIVARKAQQQTRLLTLEQVRNMYDKTIQADLDIKTGKFDPNIALQLLLLTINE